jgi:hypothetical protein
MRSSAFLVNMFFMAACSVDGYYVKPDATPEASVSWLKHIRGNGAESVSTVASASDGSVFIAGQFEQTIDLGGGPLTAAGVDFFIAKFGANGQHIWSKNWSSYGSPEHWGAKLRPLSNGDLVLGGEFVESLTLGSTTLNSVGDQDVFIARFSNTGEPIWVRSGGSAAYDHLGDLSVDPNDNIVACGEMYESGSFFGSPTLSGAPTWLTRITGTGDHSWSRAMPTIFGSGCGVASMPDGDVGFAGNFTGTISAGGPTFTSNNGSDDIYMARYAAADGDHRWSAAKGGSGIDYVSDVEALSSSLVITGGFRNTVSFGGSPLTAQANDAFVAKFDASNGNHQFSVSMGGPSDDTGRRVAARSDGQLTVSGVFVGTANFGGTPLSAATATSGASFVVDLDGMTGAVTSVRSGGGAVHDVATSAQSLVVGGDFGSSIMALNQELTCDGRADGYVLVFKR